MKPREVEKKRNRDREREKEKTKRDTERKCTHLIVLSRSQIHRSRTKDVQIDTHHID